MRPMMVALIAAVLAAPAAAQERAAVLARDARELQRLLPGVWDNAEQFFFAKEAGDTIARRHLEIVRDGDGRLSLNDGDAKRAISIAVDTKADAIIMAGQGCDVRWRREGAQFAGDARSPSCLGATRLVIAPEDLWLDGLQMRRAREWTCWLAAPREGKPDSWFYARDLKLSDGGGEVWVSTDDPTPRRIGFRLRQVRWPAGTNQDALTLYVLRDGEARAPGYAWASPDATRIGVNLRWVQGSCSRPGGQDATRPAAP